MRQRGHESMALGEDNTSSRTEEGYCAGAGKFSENSYQQFGKIRVACVIQDLANQLF